MDNTVAVALVAGMLGLFLLVQLQLMKAQQSSTTTTAASSSKSKKKKPKKKTTKKSSVTPVTASTTAVVATDDDDDDDDDVEPELKSKPEPAAAAVKESTTAASKKKKKKKAGVVASSEPEEVTPAPSAATATTTTTTIIEPVSTVMDPDSTSAAAAKKKKKKKNKKKNGTASGEENTNGTAAAAPTNGTALQSTATPPEEDGFITIPKRSSKNNKPVANDANVKTEGGVQTVTLTIDEKDIPLIIGPKGSTIQRLTTELGAKIDVSKSNFGQGQVKISDEDEDKVANAAQVISTMVAEEKAKREAATAYSASLKGKDIKGDEGGVKAIIGKAGTVIQKIQTTTGCKLNASIDNGTVDITGPSQEAVDLAVKLCKNAVFGEAQSSIDLKTQSMVMAVCGGKGFTHLRKMQDESGARLDFAQVPATGKKTRLDISGDVAHVQKAKQLIAARMQAVAGISIEFDATKTGAIYGKGGTNLRRIQDNSGAIVEVMDDKQSGRGENVGLVKIFGEADKVKTAQDMIMRALSGEIELNPGEVLEKMDCGIGAAAVIGKGGSKIAELEKDHKVKLNIKSGSGECSIVGKKDNVEAAKTAIEGIVEPLKQKAIEEAKIQQAAEELDASGDDTWGAADGAGSWDDAVEENGW